MKKYQIGCVNWNAILPDDTYFGRWVAHSLSVPKFHKRLPYYATLSQNGKAVFRKRSPEEYDNELLYAIEAGIDYFAYCRYTYDDALDVVGSDLDHVAHWNDLNHACLMHRQSRLRDKIGYCLILRPSKMNDRDFETLPEELAADCYVKIDGRPLVYTFGDTPADLLEGRLKLLDAMKRHSAPVPYIAGMSSYAPTSDLSNLDALSRYAFLPEQCATYPELVKFSMNENNDLIDFGKPVIPLFSVGWNPTPRIESPVPWITYPDAQYSEALPEEITQGLIAFAQYVDENKKAFPTGHILTFAWNEFEEGGYLCPTLGADGQPDKKRMDAFAQGIAKIQSSIQ